MKTRVHDCAATVHVLCDIAMMNNQKGLILRKCKLSNCCVAPFKIHNL